MLIRQSIWLRVNLSVTSFMLTADKCRALIEDTTISDTEIEAFRSALYDSVQLALEVYCNDRNSGSKNPFGFLQSEKEDDTFLICNENPTKPQ